MANQLSLLNIAKNHIAQADIHDTTGTTATNWNNLPNTV